MTLASLFTLLLLLQNSPTASVEGRVLRDGDEPLSGVEVILNKALSPSQQAMAPPPGFGPPSPFSAVTDGQGRFTILNVEPGSYMLTFAKNGYVRQDHGVRAPSAPGSPVTLKAGQTLKDIVMRMTATASVSGRIQDVNRQPVAGIEVQLFRRGYGAGGQKSVQPAVQTRTDDRGEYRLYFVTPGRYYLTATSSPTEGLGVASQLTGVSPNVAAVRFATTFYPGVTDLNQATAIELRPGAELGGMNMTVERQRLFQVSGRIIDAGGIPSNSVSVMLLSRAAAGNFAPFGNPRDRLLPRYDAATGTYQVTDIPPGDYGIVANQNISMGFVRFGVGTANVENLTIALAPGFSISGRLSVEGQPDLSSVPNRERTRVQLRTLIDGAETTITNVFSMLAPVPNPNGTFTIDNVRPIEYRVGVLQMPDGYYVKEARFGGADAFNQPLRLSPSDSGTLQIVLSPKVGQIRGTVLDERMQPAGGMQVVLVPDRNRDRPELYQAVTSDADGRFTIDNVAPRDYRIFAWEDIEPYAWFDPDVIRQVESQGKRIHIAESARETVEVRVVQ